mmetsp:Transcript_142973/g.356280  ORF Transcript_142973/g.356280 Transcript_142973/m.356280 type:complete len:132 (-) Transcript_142973:1825-2220(-)
MAMSSSCLPCSKILPSCTTQIASALRIVDRRWAMTRVVRRFSRRRLSKASWTMRSLAVSKALVASSSKRTAGLRTTARAMAIRCFWPPENLQLLEKPTLVWYCFGSCMMKPCAFESFAASIARSSSTSLRP